MVSSFRIGYVHAGMYSLLPKSQRINSPEITTLTVCWPKYN